MSSSSSLIGLQELLAKRLKPLGAPLLATHKPHNGGGRLSMTAQAYGTDASVSLIVILDDSKDQRIGAKLDLAIYTLWKAFPDLKLEKAIWVLKPQVGAEGEAAVLESYRIGIAGRTVSRKSAGQVSLEVLDKSLRN